MEMEDTFVWTSVRVVCREWLRGEDLPHAVRQIHAYIGTLSLFALPNAVEQGNISLDQFYRVLHAVDESATLVLHEKLRQYREAMYLVPSKIASQEGALEAMQQLYKRYPGCVDRKVVEAIGEMADLPTLKWLHACDPLLFTNFGWLDKRVFCYASLKGRTDVVRWLVELFPDQVRYIMCASQGGHLKLVKWLIRNSKWDGLVDNAFVVAVASGQLETAQFLLQKHTATSMKMSVGVTSEDDNSVIRWLTKTASRNEYCAVDAAASGGHIDMIQWLHANFPKCFSSRTMDCAARNGHLEVVEFLHRNRSEGCTARAMDGAVANGHFDMVQWLHQNRREGCTTDAMDSCTAISILNWLSTYQNKGCTAKAMEKALRKDRFDIAKWLHDQQGLHYPDTIVDQLAGAGELELLMWLHSHREGKWSKNTMNEAAGHGHLDVVKFLNEYRREGCTKQAMNIAAGNNHLDVVKWLHANRKEGCSVLAMTNAAAGGHLKMVQWLHTHRHEGCTPAAMSEAASGGHVRVMEFLAASFSMKWPKTAMQHAIENKKILAMKWLHTNLQPLTAKDSYHAARSDNIGALEFIRAQAPECITKTVYFAGNGNGHPEVVKWYEDYYGNPRKRKTSELT